MIPGVEDGRTPRRGAGTEVLILNVMLFVVFSGVRVARSKLGDATHDGTVDLLEPFGRTEMRVKNEGGLGEAAFGSERVIVNVFFPTFQRVSLKIGECCGTAGESDSGII
jgi:hypothetical protein